MKGRRDGWRDGGTGAAKITAVVVGVDLKLVANPPPVGHKVYRPLPVMLSRRRCECRRVHSKKRWGVGGETDRTRIITNSTWPWWS